LGELNSLEHTARFFGLSPMTVETMFLDGGLEGVKVGRKTAFTRGAILGFIEQHTQQHAGAELLGPTTIRRHGVRRGPRNSDSAAPAAPSAP
jgi:hypothetical protein